MTDVRISQKNQKNLILRNSGALIFKLLKHGICALSSVQELYALIALGFAFILVWRHTYVFVFWDR